MKNISDILQAFGVSIPAEKQEDFNREFLANYKTINDYNKKVQRLEGDAENWKERAETAENTLKSFEGVDIETVKGELATWKKKAEDAETEYNSRIYERDFNDALKIGLNAHEFTSESARRSIMAEIKEAGLKLKDGKILGLDDAIQQAKEKDPGAFVDKQQKTLEESKKKFTDPMSRDIGGQNKTKKDEIMSIADRKERRLAIAKNKLWEANN